jgi:hypothetical protein
LETLIRKKMMEESTAKKLQLEFLSIDYQFRSEKWKTWYYLNFAGYMN